MNKNLLICGISTLLVVLVLSGCIESQSQSSEEKRFVGTWNMEGVEKTVIFHSDGDMNVVFGDKYEVKDGKLVILTRFAGGYTQESYDYTFSNNDTRLILINIDTKVIHSLIKQ
jgi:hypothetical protein